MARRIIVVFFLLTASAANVRAAGLTPYLVKDINQMPQPADGRPEALSTFGSLALFAAEDGENGRELWRSDGTETGTYPLLDACEGECSGGVRWVAGSSPRGNFFWSVRDGHFGLWITDGTSAGTVLLNPDLTFSSATQLGVWIPALGRFFFAARDLLGTHQLWTSDGTPAGTHPVAASRFPNGSNPYDLRSFRDRLYYTAYDSTHGRALWTSDGTDAGTRLVKDTWPGASSGPLGLGFLRVVGKRLVFAASSPRHGNELWTSDGTSKGTVELADLTPGTANTFFWEPRVFGSRVYFIAQAGNAGQEILRTDGTPKGTSFVTSFAPAEPFGLYPYLPFDSAGSGMLFGADDGAHGSEPWIVDGTTKRARLLADVCPGSCSSTSPNPVANVIGTRWFLALDDGTHGQEMWVLDGLASAPRMLRETCPGDCGRSLYGFHVVNDKLVFGAVMVKGGDHGVWVTDGTTAGTLPLADPRDLEAASYFEAAAIGGALFFPARDDTHGLELWRTEGTPETTRRVRDIFAADFGGSWSRGVGAAGSTFYFFADDGIHGSEPWRSDGTESGTSAITELEPGDDPRSAPHAVPSAAIGSTLVYAADARLWRTDGTAAGTFELHPDLSDFQYPRELTTAGDRVYFSAGNSSLVTRELWQTDGTVAGTKQVKDIEPGEGWGSDPRDLTAFGGRLYFAASPSETGQELWQSDGTEAGTRIVVDLVPGEGSSSPRGLTATASALLFIATTPELGNAIWRSDGTSAGTVVVAELPDSFVAEPALTTVAAGARAFFLTPSGIWVTDGTASGTRSIPVIPSVALGSHLRPAAFVDNWLYFAAVAGGEPALWRTDGTDAGTAPVRDSLGQLVAFANSLRSFAGRLVFTAAHGADTALWESDGTPAGTRPLFRLGDRPTFLGQEADVTVAGPRFFFQGYSREAGWELWALRPE